jgi:hypothetical protein
MKTKMNKFFAALLNRTITIDKKVLGRWNLDYCNNKINNKIDWSNVDHCGPCGHYSPAKFPLVVSPENGTEQMQTDKAALDYRYAMADAEVEVKVNAVVLHLPKTREHK